MGWCTGARRRPSCSRTNGREVKGLKAYVRQDFCEVCLIEPARIEDATVSVRRGGHQDHNRCCGHMAHGIGGPLALLSAATRRGITVTGHRDAIAAICSWLERWRTSQGQKTRWPEAIDRNQLRAGIAANTAPHRPSWCYGTPGIARAVQLAGIATDDNYQAWIAEQALLGCLTDDRHLARLTTTGLCHGSAGLIHTARTADAPVPPRLPRTRRREVPGRTSRRGTSHPRRYHYQSVYPCQLGHLLADRIGDHNWGPGFAALSATWNAPTTVTRRGSVDRRCRG
jgi:hypothetical protein